MIIGLIGSYFFDDESGSAATVTSEWNVDMFQTFVPEQFQNASGRHISWFHQDETTVCILWAAAVRQQFHGLAAFTITKFIGVHTPLDQQNRWVENQDSRRNRCNFHGNVSTWHAKFQYSLPGMDTFEWPLSYGNCFWKPTLLTRFC